jgi:predicted RNase H-like nuclease
VSIALDEAAAVAGAHIFERLDALMAHHRAARVIAVDMPIALVDSGDRDADRAARQLLRGQASTIFNSPARPVLDEPDFASACAASERLSGKRISRQSFALFPKIIEVRAFIADPRPLRPAQPR